MTPALSTIACASVRSASAAARSASQISNAHNKKRIFFNGFSFYILELKEELKEHSRTTYITDPVEIRS